MFSWLKKRDISQQIASAAKELSKAEPTIGHVDISHAKVSDFKSQLESAYNIHDAAAQQTAPNQAQETEPTISSKLAIEYIEEGYFVRGALNGKDVTLGEMRFKIVDFGSDCKVIKRSDMDLVSDLRMVVKGSKAHNYLNRLRTKHSTIYRGDEALMYLHNGGTLALPSWNDAYIRKDEKTGKLVVRCKSTAMPIHALSADFVITCSQWNSVELNDSAIDKLSRHVGAVAAKAPERCNDFSFAMRYLKAGHKLQRKGWNGKGQYVVAQVNATVTSADKIWNVHNKEHAIKLGGTITVAPYLTLKTAQDTLAMGWIPSTGDLFAEDWQLAD